MKQDIQQEKEKLEQEKQEAMSELQMILEKKRAEIEDADLPDDRKARLRERVKAKEKIFDETQQLIKVRDDIKAEVEQAKNSLNNLTEEFTKQFDAEQERKSMALQEQAELEAKIEDWKE
eukprot:3571901-Pyramimonas_sp.AAC.1